MTAGDGTAGPRRGGLSATLRAVGLAIFAVLPAFLTGALAVGIRAELDFGPAALGLAVAWFFVTSALCATPLGQLVERFGLRLSLTAGAAASAVALGGLAAAPHYVLVLAAMTVGGAANALVQPAVNALLSERIPSARLGFAFGVKQSAIPAATLLGGLAVPTLATVVGWRGTFAVAAAAAALSAAAAWFGRDVTAGASFVRGARRRVRDMPEVRSLILLSTGGFFGAAAATSLGAFLVDAGVATGLPEASAGLLMALASALGLTARISLGWYVDRRPARSRYGTIVTLLCLGVPGYVLLTSDVPALYVVGALLAYAAGWAWPGVFHYAVVSQNPVTPATATGVVQTGMSLGAGLGPLGFGVLAERAGYDAAWVLAAVLGSIAAVLFLLGRAHLRRSRRTASAAHLGEVSGLLWEPGPARPVADGIEAQDHVTANLRVTLYRAAPGARGAPPPAPRTGVVFVLGGGEVHLQVAGVATVAAEGDYLPLPSNRAWSLHNRGEGALLVAQVEHLGNSRRPG
jgi:MFS family permease